MDNWKIAENLVMEGSFKLLFIGEEECIMNEN